MKLETREDKIVFWLLVFNLVWILGGWLFL